MGLASHDLGRRGESLIGRRTGSSKYAGPARLTFGDDRGQRVEHSKRGVTRAGEYY